MRKALIRSLVENLVVAEKMTTTETKAKELRPVIEKLITLSKKPTLASRRIVRARVGLIASKKLHESIGPKYKDRNGGYTRITKIPNRKSDGSGMAVIEFV